MLVERCGFILRIFGNCRVLSEKKNLMPAKSLTNRSKGNKEKIFSVDSNQPLEAGS
jgi:hypothetical protein